MEFHDTIYLLWLACRCNYRYLFIRPLPAVSAGTKAATSSKLVWFLRLNRHSFQHNLFKVIIPITTLSWCAKRERMSLLWKLILENNLTNSSARAILEARSRESYPPFIADSQNLLISTFFLKVRDEKKTLIPILLIKKSPSFFSFILRISTFLSIGCFFVPHPWSQYSSIAASYLDLNTICLWGLYLDSILFSILLNLFQNV